MAPGRAVLTRFLCWQVAPERTAEQQAASGACERPGALRLRGATAGEPCPCSSPGLSGRRGSAGWIPEALQCLAC